ncbi:hypothetical protein [Arthrobacter globiformis]|uniref:hypothetical protein n=1 Tax=Arthrobacter globiformis TaxID=1665 RepID=UPI002793A805|nr:hypothetical protein [Arthrobacter globiformis]MDQ0620636.1 hypothetical protein [Arthrobacter globiformis]
MSSDQPTPERREVPERREISVRRAPKYVPFLILGGLVGFAAAAVIAYALPGDASYDRGAVYGFFMVPCAAAGVILGAISALVLDRTSVRRARRGVVEAVPEAELSAEGTHQATAPATHPAAEPGTAPGGAEPGPAPERTTDDGEPGPRS